ncbi:MAG: choice-of-anchor J domain-containing protein [Dysgonamonadaceae bacterium]|jgi:hypothetical protein|nr:choice-of-anchor J domain-containing protein [Dysgonamonadaceae bacterium]
MKKNLFLFVFVWLTAWGYSQSREGTRYDDGTNSILIKDTVSESENSLFYYNGSVYTSIWTESAGLLHVYTPSGTELVPAGTVMISNMPDNPGANFYGFASDGTFIYAVNQSASIFVIDPTTMSLQRTIETTIYPEIVGPVTIAYDAAQDGFWCSYLNRREANFIRKDGNATTKVLKGPFHVVMGLAYDDTSDGGPYLWASTGNKPVHNYAKIGRWNLYTGEYTEEIKNVPYIMGVPTGGNYMGAIYLTQDIRNGKQVLLGVLPSQTTLFGYDLDNTFPVQSPDKVGGFSCISGASGALNAGLSWKNPARKLNGTALSQLDSVHIYRNNRLVHTLSTPTAGAEAGWTDNTLVSPGIYNYKITAENEAGEGVATVRTVFAGLDVPAAVDDLSVTKVNKNGRISWSAPTEGANKGWISPIDLTYKVVRKPDNAVIADNLTATHCIDSTAVFLNMYSYTVTAKNESGEGLPATSATVSLGSSVAIPWQETFATPETLPLWTIINANKDETSWIYNPYNGGGSMQCVSSGAQDDWLISPSVRLESGKKYRLQWSTASINDTPVHYEVTMGTDTTVASQTTALASGNVNSSSFVPETKEITVSTTGVYHFAWRSLNSATEEIKGITIDAISIESVINDDLSATGISGAGELFGNAQGAFTVRVKNKGVNAENSFSVDLLVYKGNTYIDKQTLTAQEALNPNGEKDFVFRYAFSEAGDFTLKGAVTMTGGRDENAANDTTAAHSVKVYPVGISKVYIGDPASEEYTQLSPVNCYYEHHASQSFYYEEEINKNGLITAIEYYYSFQPGHPVYDKPVQIYMAVTQEDDLREGWVKEDMYLVYDGLIQLPDNQKSVTIPLQQPFVYSGGNLVIHTQGNDTKVYHPFNQFQETKSDRMRRRVFADHFHPFTFTQTGRTQAKVTNTSLLIDEKGGSLSGTVTDNNQQPVENASVVVEGKPWKTTTDAAGKFRFEFFPATTSYTLKVSKPGYGLQTHADVMPANDYVNNCVLTACTSQPVKNLVKTLHTPEKYMVQLTWEAPDGISSDHYVTAYHVSVNHLLKATVPAGTLFYRESVPFGASVYAVSAVWNNGCESAALSENVEMTPTVITEYPFVEGFESGKIPESWEENHLENDLSWEVISKRSYNDKTFTAHSGTYFASISDNDHYFTTTRLVTPMLDISSLSQPALSFWHVQAVWGFDRDSLAVYYRTEPQGKWKKLAEYGDDIEAWKKEILPLPEASRTYQIGFEGISLFGYGVMLDDVRVSEKETAIVNPDIEASISVYPNPVLTDVTVSGENLKRIEIYNIFGKLLDNIVLNGKEKTINMQSYAAGMYVLKIFVSENQFVGKRIVVSR